LLDVAGFVLRAGTDVADEDADVADGDDLTVSNGAHSWLPLEVVHDETKAPKLDSLSNRD
jgi:hypothetical protein